MSSCDNVFEALLLDEAFISDFSDAGNEPISQSWFMSKDKKFTYGSIYIGWLIGRHGGKEAKVIVDSIVKGDSMAKGEG